MYFHLMSTFLTLAMSKIWAAMSVQCQAFLMKNDFLDSEWYGYVFLVKKHVKPYIFSFSGSWATKWLLWQLPLVSEKSKMAAQNGRKSPVMSLKTGLSPHKWLYTKALCGTWHLGMITVINWVALKKIGVKKINFKDFRAISVQNRSAESSVLIRYFSWKMHDLTYT